MALVIDKGALDLLGIDDKTPLNTATDSKVLMISPVRGKKHCKEFEEALEKVNWKFGRTLMKLAS